MKRSPFDHCLIVSLFWRQANKERKLQLASCQVSSCDFLLASLVAQTERDEANFLTKQQVLKARALAASNLEIRESNVNAICAPNLRRQKLVQILINELTHSLRQIAAIYLHFSNRQFCAFQLRTAKYWMFVFRTKNFRCQKLLFNAHLFGCSWRNSLQRPPTLRLTWNLPAIRTVWGLRAICILRCKRATSVNFWVRLCVEIRPEFVYENRWFLCAFLKIAQQKLAQSNFAVETRIKNAFFSAKLCLRLIRKQLATRSCFKNCKLKRAHFGSNLIWFVKTKAKRKQIAVRSSCARLSRPKLRSSNHKVAKEELFCRALILRTLKVASSLQYCAAFVATKKLPPTTKARNALAQFAARKSVANCAR